MLLALVMLASSPDLPALSPTPAQATPSPVYAAPSPAHNGQPLPDVTRAVVIVAKDGSGALITTGAGEADVAAQPIEGMAQYNLDICQALQSAKPWVDWGCVDTSRG